MAGGGRVLGEWDWKLSRWIVREEQGSRKGNQYTPTNLQTRGSQISNMLEPLGLLELYFDGFDHGPLGALGRGHIYCLPHHAQKHSTYRSNARRLACTTFRRSIQMIRHSFCLVASK